MFISLIKNTNREKTNLVDLNEINGSNASIKTIDNVDSDEGIYSPPKSVQSLRHIKNKLDEFMIMKKNNENKAKNKIHDNYLIGKQIEKELKYLSKVDIDLAPEQQSNLKKELSKELTNNKIGTPSWLAENNIISDSDLWLLISITISEIDFNYLKYHENITSKYTEFYQEFNNVILAKMGDWVNPGKDSNNIKLNTSELINELNKLINKYSTVSIDHALVPPQYDNSTLDTLTYDEAKMWLIDLALPDDCLKEYNGGYVITIDIKPLRVMLDEIKKLINTNSEIDSAKYHAWQSGFKSQEETLKSTLQTLTQKYSNANSLYDNLVKILSSTIASCLEAEKSFLHT